MVDLNSIFSLDNTESDEATNDGGPYDREESVSSHTYNIRKQNYPFSKPDRPFGNVRPSFLDHLSTSIYPELEVRQAVPDPWIEWMRDPLFPKTKEIVAGIKEATCQKPKTSAITIKWSHLLEKMCFDTFSPPQMRRYMTLYWSSWHPNCPMLHKPTFSPANASAGLVASMVLVGASLSLEASDKNVARLWFNSVEEMVFDHKRLYHSPPREREGELQNWKRLEALQAAYFICVLQNWEGAEENWQRIRNERHNTLVTVTKDLIRSSPNLTPVNTKDPFLFDWKAFIYREVFSRTLTQVFLLDVAFFLFTDSPPKILAQEMEVDLTYPEESFQALSSKECFAMLSVHCGDTKEERLTLRSAISSICKENLTSQFQSRLTRMSIYNMFTIISGLHSLLAQIQALLSYGSQLSAVEHGLRHWKETWLRSSISLGSDSGICEVADMWKRVGFMRHAMDSWQLAQIFLKWAKLAEKERIANEVTFPVTTKLFKLVIENCDESGTFTFQDPQTVGDW